MPTRLVALLLAGLLAPPAFAARKGGPTGPLRPDRGGEKWARKTLGKLSLEEKVGQLFMVWVRARFVNDASPEYLELRDAMRQYHVGSFAMSVPADGPALSRSRPEEGALLLNRLQRESKHPLLVAADFEAGVAVRLDGATPFPQAMAFGGAGRPEAAREYGRIVAQEARAVGVHWNFFPVADVNSNPANPIINTRSFGEDPQQVAELVAAYVAGARQGGMLTTAKHFPGHGDTDTDSHYGMARVGGDVERLESVELPPFRAAIEAGVDSIMVAHVTVPALEASPDTVATTSRAVVSGLLKDRLAFRGLVVTDALDMAGLTRQYAANIGRAAVDAFKAGNDMLLIPADLGASWKAMVESVRSGEVPLPHLDASVLKILELKAALGLHRSRLADVARVSSLVGRPENVAVGQQAADEAVTLVRDEGRLLPLGSAVGAAGGLPYSSVQEVRNRLVVVILSADERGPSGRLLEQEVRARVPDANVLSVDHRIAAGVSEQILQAAGEAERVIVAAFVAPDPGQATDGASPGATTGRLLGQLLERAGEKTVVVAVGSPYVAQSFPHIRTYLCTLSSAPVSERSAVKALFGEIALGGRLPVSIPGVAARGDGIPREATPTRPPPATAR